MKMINNVLEYLKIFSTRELSVIIWLLILLLFVLMNQKIRYSFLNVIKILFGKQLIKIWIIITIYVIFISYIFSKTMIWNNYYIKDIFIWFITCGSLYCFNAASYKADEHYVKKALKDNLKYTIFIEYIYSTFTFNIIIELLLIPIITILSLVESFTEKDSQYIYLNKFLKGVITILSICFFYKTIKIGINEYKNLNMVDTIVKFLIPVVYIILISPIEYIIELYSNYQTLFTRMFFKSNRDKKNTKKHKRLIIRECGLSVYNVLLFQKNYCNIIYNRMSDQEFLNLIEDFKNNKKNK